MHDLANRTKKHGNIASYNETLKGKTHKVASNTSDKAAQEWAAKLRNFRSESNRAPSQSVSRNDETARGGRSAVSTYAEDDVPKVYYKQTDNQRRQEKKEYVYNGNF
jgi:GTPase involved in cell partitioning and DNA repair